MAVESGEANATSAFILTGSILVCVAGCVACKVSDQPAGPAAASSAKRDVPALAVQLGVIQKRPADFAAWSDPSPGHEGSYALKPIAGTRLASFVSYPKVPNAWRFGLEGFACARVNELGVDVVELHHGAGTHEDASWYRVKGGPLDGALVEVLVEETNGLCNAMPGTPEYWKFMGSRLPSLASDLARYAP